MSITIGNVDNLYTSQECKLLKFTIDNEHGYSKKNTEYPRSRGPNKRGPDTKQYKHSVLETCNLKSILYVGVQMAFPSCSPCCYLVKYYSYSMISTHGINN